MVALKPREIDPYIAEKPPQHSLILVYGPDRGLVLERAGLVINNSKLNEADDLDIIRLRAADIDGTPGRLADEAYAMGLFGGKRILRIDAAGSSNLVKALEPILKDPPEETLIVVEAGNLRPGSPLRSRFEKAPNAAAIPCYVDDALALRTLINQELVQKGIALTRDVEAFLLDHLGADRGTTRAELQKIFLYAMDKSELVYDDLLLILSDVSALNNDKIIDQIFSGAFASTFVNLEKTINEGAGTSLLLALNRHIELLLRLQTQIANGVPARDSVKRCQPPIFFKRQEVILKQLEKWSVKKLHHAHTRVNEAIMAGRTKPRLEQTLLFELATAFAGAAKR